MQFNLEDLPAPMAYRLLAAAVTPRPIAWITTLSKAGIVNAAPFSFFNLMGSNPPVIVLGIVRNGSGGFKDTARNIAETREFVANLVSEDIAPKMGMTAMDAPYGTSELDEVGLTPRPSERVKPPHVAEAPVSLECVHQQTVATGPSQEIVVGRILQMCIDDRFVLDAERGHIDTPALRLVARMHGKGWYTRSSSLFRLNEPSYEEWRVARARERDGA